MATEKQTDKNVIKTIVSSPVKKSIKRLNNRPYQKGLKIELYDHKSLILRFSNCSFFLSTLDFQFFQKFFKIKMHLSFYEIHSQCDNTHYYKDYIRSYCYYNCCSCYYCIPYSYPPSYIIQQTHSNYKICRECVCFMKGL